MRIKKFNESSNDREKVLQDFNDIYYKLSEIGDTEDSIIGDDYLCHADDDYKIRVSGNNESGYLANYYAVDIISYGVNSQRMKIDYDKFSEYYDNIGQIKYVLDVYKDDYIMQMNIAKNNGKEFLEFYIISKTVKD